MTNNLDLDQALAELENGVLGQQLNGQAQRFSPAPATIQRIQAGLQPPVKRGNSMQAFFQRRPGRALAMAVCSVAVGLGLIFGLNQPTRSVSAAELLQRAETFASQPIVANGKARHIAIEIATTSSDGQIDEYYRDEIWLVQGQSHILLYQPARQSLNGQPVGYQMGPTIVDENYFWNYNAQDNTSVKAPFDECSLSLEQWVGEGAFGSDSNFPNATILRSEEIDGRQLTVVDLGGDMGIAWIDANTGQIWKFTSSQTYEGITTETLVQFVVDETVELNALPAEWQTYTAPAGSPIIEQSTPYCIYG
ncbi:outer membrane lipoprotein carrier protein LolA [Herpetosiphon sp. NSE202]|uniref:LolA family protein n=1 Tax=Herpetosiphon sp. NSE202 TaxID=3351349 RepID=UPI00362A93C8